MTMAQKDSSFATIISLLPMDRTETKPGLNPNEYIIKGMEKNLVGLTVIPNNVFYLVNPDPLADAKDTRWIKVPVPAIEVAQSIINDYVSALLGVEPPDAQPGWIAVTGNYIDPKQAKLDHLNSVMVALAGQNRWFKNLVDIADDAWSKTRSPLGISDLQRIAASSLELKRDWVNPVAPELVDKCPVCKTNINEGAIKCIACGHILDKQAYEKVMAGV